MDHNAPEPKVTPSYGLCWYIIIYDERNVANPKNYTSGSDKSLTLLLKKKKTNHLSKFYILNISLNGIGEI